MANYKTELKMPENHIIDIVSFQEFYKQNTTTINEFL